MNRNALLKLALKFAVSLVILWYASAHFAWQDAMRLMGHGRPAWFAVALLWSLLSIALAAWRWDLLAGRTIGAWRATRLVLVSSFFGLFLPGTVSADVIKGAHLALEDRNHRNASTATCIMADRVIGLIVMLFFALIAGLMGLGGEQVREVWSHIMYWIAGGLGVLVAGVAVVLSIRGRMVVSGIAARVLPGIVSRPVSRLLEAAAGPWPGRSTLALIALVSLLNQVCGVLSVSAVCRFIGQDITFAQSAVFFCLASLSTVIPVTVAGVGVRDWIAVRLFSGLGSKAEVGAAISMSMLAVMLCLAALGGLIYASHSLLGKQDRHGVDQA